MRTIRLLPVLLLSLSLVACAPGATTSAKAAPTSTPAPPTQPTATQVASTVTPAKGGEGLGGSEDLTRVDEQGAVTVQVTPLDLAGPGRTLDFDVRMNTHSVDLGMDLAGLATLSTDGGLSVSAVKWEAPGGGHHVSGKLSFPAAAGGKPLLQGATKLTLTLRDVGAPQRVFTWELE